LVILPPLPRPPHVPYTTLFRSGPEMGCVICHPERSEGSRLSSISRLIETLRSAQSNISILLLSHSPILPFSRSFVLLLPFIISAFQRNRLSVDQPGELLVGAHHLRGPPHNGFTSTFELTERWSKSKVMPREGLGDC